jgi:hypothetical protein
MAVDVVALVRPGGPPGTPRAARGQGDQGDDAPALPPEVLKSAVEGGHLFVDRMDDWRRSLGMTHVGFAAYLGISRNYWWLLRTHQRELTIGVAQRVLRERPEFEYFLSAAIRGRRWGHRQD